MKTLSVERWKIYEWNPNSGYVDAWDGVFEMGNVSMEGDINRGDIMP